MANDTVEIKITGDSSDLAAAMKDVADRLELLHQALAGTAGKFTEVGQDAEKSMTKVGKSSKKAADAVEDFGKEAEKAGKRAQAFEGIADGLGRMDSSLSAFSTIMDNFSPKMAEFTRLAADAAGASEQLILALTQARGAFIATAVVVAAGGLVYKELTEELEETDKLMEKIGEQSDRLGKAIEKNRSRVESYRKELALLNGSETSYEQTLKERLLTLDAAQEKELRFIKQRARLQLQAARNAKEEENVQFLFERGTQNVISRYNEERNLVQSLFDIAEANEKAAEAERKRAETLKFTSSEYAKAKTATTSLGEELEVYVHQMTAAERAASTSTEAHQKMAGALIANGIYAMELGEQFAKNEEDLYGTSVSLANTGAEYDRFSDAIDFLNERYKENLGIQEDVFVVAEKNGRTFGATNRLTLESVNVWDLLNLAYEEHIRKQRELAAQQERNAAKWKAWRDERDALLKSLREENDIIDAQLAGPYKELEQAYTAQIHNLDEIVDRYAESAKTNKKSAELVAEAEEQKRLVTARFLEERQELVEENAEKERQLAEQAAREAERIETEKLNAIARLRNISDGAEAESYAERLEEIRQFSSDQLKEARDAYQELIDMGANEAAAFAAFQEEKSQINAEFHQKRRKINEETSKKEREQRHEDISSFASASTVLLQGTSAAFMAIAEHADQMSVEQRRKMFYISQAAAMGEIAINGIIAISEIWKEHAGNPIAAGVMTAGMAGITAAQIAEVAAQEPSFDIGGVIKGGLMAKSADQVGVNVLPGESVLNRSATERLGENGVNALNSGRGMGQEIIVVPAYRHFDRFIKDEYRKGGAFRKFFNDAREYPVGQRSY